MTISAFHNSLEIVTRFEQNQINNALMDGDVFKTTPIEADYYWTLKKRKGDGCIIFVRTFETDISPIPCLVFDTTKKDIYYKGSTLIIVDKTSHDKHIYRLGRCTHRLIHKFLNDHEPKHFSEYEGQ